MLGSVVTKTIGQQKKSLFWWAIGLISTAAFIISYYPSIRDNSQALTQYVQKLPESFKAMFAASGAAISTPAGYLNMELFSFMAPLLFLIFAIGVGANAIAGEEEKGTLDLLLSSPIPRWRLVVEKFAAMVVSILGLAFVFWVTLAFGARAIDMHVSLAKVAQMTVSLTLLGLAFGALALAVGSATGKKGPSIGLASGLGVVSYMLNTFAPMVKALEQFRKLSLFYYYNGKDPLTNGLNLEHTAVLVLVTLALFGTAIAGFQKRDLGRG